MGSFQLEERPALDFFFRVGQTRKDISPPNCFVNSPRDNLGSKGGGVREISMNKASRIMRLSATVLVALAAAQAAHANLSATVYADWQRDGVLSGKTGDITFQGLTQLGQFVDPNIAHWDGTKRYRWMPFGRDEKYSVLWTGFLIAPTAGTYQFRTTSDDGVQVLLRGENVIYSPVLQYFKVNTGSTNLVAGSSSIEVRFYENAVFDGIRLEWMKPGDTTWTIIPPEVLAVPEPSSAALIVGGLALVINVVRRSRLNYGRR